MPWVQAPSRPITPSAARNARTMRRSLTEPEKRLWWHLRHRLPVAGTHFRRQVPIGSYVADFCCLGERLIVEVDGGGHSEDLTRVYDVKRTSYLEGIGYRVIRFTNGEVMSAMDSVLDTIFAALSTPLHEERLGVGRVPLPEPSKILCGEAPARSSRSRSHSRAPNGATPTPDPSPQGGGE